MTPANETTVEGYATPRAPPPATGAHLPDAHLAQRVAHGVDRVPHFVGTDGADAADAERLDLRKLARIENEALVTDARVELLEVVRRVGRRMERQDDRRLYFRLQEELEAELGESGDERLAILRIARRAAPAGRPSATCWSSAALNATTTCVAGV